LLDCSDSGWDATFWLSVRVERVEILRIKVKPSSKQQKIERQEDGSLLIYLKSPPVDGKANQELIKLLSDRFDIPKSHITIKSGLSSKHKLIELDR
jgi:uncharacterized protein (TIGR00251 family)